MSDQKGSVLGGILLIGGSCIGAGMLGLPILTGLCGFIPSLILLVCGWLFMTTTALLLVEAGGWFPKQVNLLTMTQHALGKWGKGVCWVTYLFLFYALLVAYIAGIGSVCRTFLQGSFSLSIPSWLGGLLFVVLFGWIIYLGTRRVDLFNRFLMIGKIGFFVLLVAAGVFYVDPGLLTRSDTSYALAALPLLVISFGFHNMIPSLTAYMKGDLKRVRRTILGGSVMILCIYILWEFVVLGIVPLEGPHGLLMSFQTDQEASQAIAALLNSPSIRMFAQGLAFFALLTSFLSQSLSLVHFLADGFKVSYKRQENVSLCLLALLPPLVLSTLYPQLFFKALNFAGGVCAVVLFGLLPVAMVWMGRKLRTKATSSYTLFGGNLVLGLVSAVALGILALQLASMCGISLMPAL